VFSVGVEEHRTALIPDRFSSSVVDVSGDMHPNARMTMIFVIPSEESATMDAQAESHAWREQENTSPLHRKREIARAQVPWWARIFSVAELEAILHRRGEAPVSEGVGAVVLYARVSSRHQAQEGDLERQLARLGDTAKAEAIRRCVPEGTKP